MAVHTALAIDGLNLILPENGQALGSRVLTGLIDLAESMAADLGLDPNERKKVSRQKEAESEA